MRLSPKYMDKEIGIYVPERKKIVGVVRVVSQITYPTKKEFDADYSRHLVGEDSPFYPKRSGKKIGFVLEDARAITPISPKGRPYGSTISKNPMTKGSAKTSRAIVPAGAKYVTWIKGSVNLDMGGGKFETFTNWLKLRGVRNLIFDPYNRSVEHNKKVLATVLKKKADTGTMFNVLNVLPNKQEMLKLLINLKSIVKGKIYISVYEGDKSGKTKMTRDGIQHNRRLTEYIKIVREVLPDAIRRGAIIESKGK
jgi:hypothetical protein